MNAHNEQPDPASPVVKQNLTTQPVAAQEAVEWQQCQKFDGVFGNWHRITKEQYDAFSARPEHYRMVRALYAAPVTAAPAGAIAAMALCANAEPQGTPEGWEKYWDGTPAAPGIDMGVHGATLTIDGKTFTVDEVRAALLPGASPKDELQSWKRGTKACAEVLGQVMRQTQDSPKGVSDPWRGLYAPERAPNRDEYGCFYHPDIPSWDDEREESIAPLLKAQGFDLQCVPGDFSDEAMEEGGERYWQEMREWNPEPEGDGWRLVAIYDTEDGPYSMFVKPLAQAGDAEVQP